MKKLILYLLLLTLLFVCLFSQNVLASEVWKSDIADNFASGEGTEDDPYIIRTPAQLAYLASSVNAGTNYRYMYFELANDIYLNDTSNWKSWGTTPPANKWTPIGTEETRFYGSFDGNGHTVHGIYINSTEDYQGLFGYIHDNVDMYNISVAESYISGNEYVGGVIGYGNAVNCYNKGSIFGTNYVGGVGGRGDLTNCYNNGNVTGSKYVGGVGGYGVFDTCYNTGIVIGSADCVGGVGGYNYSNTPYCYNTGAVSGSYDVGGVIGYNNSGEIISCYNIGTISGSYGVGGITGNNCGVVLNSYYLRGCAEDGSDTVQFGIGTSTQGEAAADFERYTVGLSDEEMKQPKAYKGFDFKNFWAIEPLTGFSYPQFVLSIDKSYAESSALWDGTVANSFADGTGTEDDPYIIRTPEQLAYLAKSVNINQVDFSDKYIKLDNDICLNDNTKKHWVLTAARWTAIGSEVYGFHGNFDGGGHEISGIYIDGKEDNQGLFGYNNGTIKNLGITKSYIRGYKHIGGVVGCNDDDAVVINCYNTSTISGFDEVGGIVGRSTYGPVTDCYNTGNITGTNQDVGGIIGYCTGYEAVITDCFNTGSIFGAGYIGGVIGRNAYGAVTACCNTGDVSGTNYHVGGVVGYSDGTVSTCYNAGSVFNTSSYTGGVVGQGNDITDCYNIGSISGEARIGGIVGSGNNITTCYNKGSVSGATEYIGGVIGKGEEATDCYYLTGCVTNESGESQRGIGESISYYPIDTPGKTTALNDEQAKNSENYTGFDFENVWAIDSEKNDGYPYLQNVPVSSTYSISTTSATANEADNKASFDFNIETNGVQTGILMVAIYDIDNHLIGFKPIDVIAKTESVQIDDMPYDGSPFSYKAFIWNGADEMENISNCCEGEF